MAIVGPSFPTIAGAADTVASKRVTFWALFQVAVNTITTTTISVIISTDRTPQYSLADRTLALLLTDATPIIRLRER